MARVARSRSRVLRGSFSGTVVRSPSPSTTTYTSPDLGNEFCVDKVGAPWSDSTLSIERGMAPRVSLSGTRTQSGQTYVVTDVPLAAAPSNYMRSPYDFGTFSKAELPGLAAMAIGNANPNRPDVDIPVSIAELRELPSLLKDGLGIIAGKTSKARVPAKANLAAQFGVLPILHDLATLFEFAKRVNARETYLRELSAGNKRIKRKLTVDTWSASTGVITAFGALADNQSTTNRCIVNGKMTRTYWYTLRASLIDVLSEREIRSLAPELVLGVSNVSASHVWNLIPWSWLIDWFSTTGDIIAAYRGGLRWQWSNLNIMYQTDYHMSLEFPAPRPGFTYSPSSPQSHGVTKHRILPTVSIYPTWYIPYLTGNQWSILSSLIVLRL
jgi:hypothetical protein